MDHPYHVGNLALADMLFGLSLFYYFLTIENKMGGSTLSYTSYLSANGLPLVSCLAIILMGIERTVVIRKPFT